MKIFLGTLVIILGVVGILMDATNNLPPELKIPVVGTVVTIIGILIVGLGWQDELTGGKTSLIDIIKHFFDNVPLRKLGLTVLLVAANEMIKLGVFPVGLTLAAQIFLAIAAVLGYSSAYASYRAKLVMMRGR